MRCAWEPLMSVLPPWLRQEVDKYGRNTMKELRLRLKAQPEICAGSARKLLPGTVRQEDITWIVNTATRYSPWAAQTTALGYLPLEGGHRIGLCGTALNRDGTMTGFQSVDSLCIRVARDYPGVSRGAPTEESLLILGAPGWGKTTLLRDLARSIAENHTVSVVDERGELFPDGFERGKRMDVLSHCPKVQGIHRVLRSMGPEWIAVDEITATEDCDALAEAAGCGVKLLATAHASSVADLQRRSVYRRLLETEVFQHVLVLNADRTWHRERVKQWT